MQASYHSKARGLLLRLIWLGDLKDCADLAADAAFGHFQDQHTWIFAGRALLATGDEPTKRRYAEFIRADCARLPNTVVSDAIDDLFPNFLAVDDLLAIFASVDIGSAWQSPNIVNRLNSQSDLERLLSGLLEQLGGEIGNCGYRPNKREEAYFPAIAATASRLLERCSENEAPGLAIDASLRLGEHHRNTSTIRKQGTVDAEVHRTAARRRLAFWRAAERLNLHRKLQGRQIGFLWDLGFLGFSPGLCVEDLDWLLTDGPKREAENERRLAIDAAMQVWREAGSPASLLKRIEEAARADAVTNAA